MLLAAYTNITEMGEASLALPLSAYRLNKLSTLQNHEVRRQGIAAERLLERLLARCVPAFSPPVELTEDEYGKPQLSEKLGLHMNLSHSGHYAACALADHPVGIDIQTITHFRQPLIQRCFTLSEQELSASYQDRDRAFTLLWALKESCIKLSGQGLRVPMNSFSLEISLEDGLASCPGVSFCFTDLGDAVLALCVPQGFDPRPERFEEIKLP